MANTKITVRSHLSTPDFKKSWDNQIIEDTRENENVFRPKNCYIGHWENKTDFVLNYHKEYEARAFNIKSSLYGHVEATKEGCLITGEFKRKKTVLIFLIFGAILTMAAALAGAYMGDYENALVALVLCIVMGVLYFGGPKVQEDKVKQKLEEIAFADVYASSKKAGKYLAKK